MESKLIGNIENKNENRKWYAIQVLGGKEESTANLCQALLNQESEELFVPRYVRKKKFNGQWQEVQGILFPGYLFVITDRVADLFFRLKAIQSLTKILRADDAFIPLQPEEISFLQHFGREEHLVEMSTGHKEGDHITITDGPLADFEGKILKIDRHKRIAIIEVDFFSRVTQVKVGLEVIDSAPPTS
ncbi:MAG: antiterminator LoaP [Lachnospiraceae bacterium]|nr:antiterminator LoaP [Lachnospiraceae bacterium]